MEHTQGQAVVKPTQQHAKDISCHDSESGLEKEKNLFLEIYSRLFGGLKILSIHWLGHLTVEQGGDNPFVSRPNCLGDVDGGQGVGEARGEADEEDSRKDWTQKRQEACQEDEKPAKAGDD